MPFSPRHEEQRRKNYTLLVVLVLLVALLFALAFVKFSVQLNAGGGQ